MVRSLLEDLGGAQLVTEEPSLSRRSPALQSKMGVWPWANMALGGCGSDDPGRERGWWRDRTACATTDQYAVSARGDDAVPTSGSARDATEDSRRGTTAVTAKTARRNGASGSGSGAILAVARFRRRRGEWRGATARGALSNRSILDEGCDSTKFDDALKAMDVALAYIDGRRQMVRSLLEDLGGAQLVTEEPSLSRRSPALQSKMGVWPWAGDGRTAAAMPRHDAVPTSGAGATATEDSDEEMAAVTADTCAAATTASGSGSGAILAVARF
ncbi:hypothetical protein Scep_009565 [Stephania cephalantha]|uniref:Uncharacterized protein n=1 Tax=Stephania cephalantha TaxID=152367 RepID=A0AAP0PEG2_9MAGN